MKENMKNKYVYFDEEGEELLLSNSENDDNALGYQSYELPVDYVEGADRCKLVNGNITIIKDALSRLKKEGVRKRFQYAPIEYNDKLYVVSKTARSNLMMIFQVMDEPIIWLTKDGEESELSKEDIRSMLKLIANRDNKLYRNKQ